MAAKKAAQASDEQVASVDDGVADSRKQALAAEKNNPFKDAKGALTLPDPGEPTIDDELVKARAAALKAEQTPKVIGSL